jgi:hypothetical protein
LSPGALPDLRDRVILAEPLDEFAVRLVPALTISPAHAATLRPVAIETGAASNVIEVAGPRCGRGYHWVRGHRSPRTGHWIRSHCSRNRHR